MNVYPLFDDFCRRVSLLNLEQSVHSFLENNHQEIPFIEIYVDKELPFTTLDLAWWLSSIDWNNSLLNTKHVYELKN